MIVCSSACCFQLNHVAYQVIIWAQPLFLWDFSSEACRVDATGEGAGGTCTFVPFYDSASIRASLGLNAINLKPADTRLNFVASDVFGPETSRWFVTQQKVEFSLFLITSRLHIFLCLPYITHVYTHYIHKKNIYIYKPKEECIHFNIWCHWIEHIRDLPRDATAEDKITSVPLTFRSSVDDASKPQAILNLQKKTNPQI